MFRNQGTDTTLEPAYFARRPRSSTSPSEDIEELIRQLEELNLIVKGSEPEDYADGLVNRVEVLEILVKQIQEDTRYKIYYDTTENWNNQPTLVSEEGSIYIYSDGKIVEKEGESIVIPRIKIGDGNAYLIDKPFIDSDIREKIETLVTITQEDIDRWNSQLDVKINNVDEENLIFYK